MQLFKIFSEIFPVGGREYLVALYEFFVMTHWNLDMKFEYPIPTLRKINE